MCNTFNVIVDPKHFIEKLDPKKFIEKLSLTIIPPKSITIKMVDSKWGKRNEKETCRGQS